MFHGKELLARVARKGPCQHVWIGPSVSGSRSVRITFGLGVQSVSDRRWSWNDMQDPWPSCHDINKSNVRSHCSGVAADHQFLPGAC